MKPWLDMIDATNSSTTPHTGTGKSAWVATPAQDMERIKKQSPRDRARRLIILGAWLLDHHAQDTQLTQLINDQLANFLKADQIPQRVKQIVWNAIHAKTNNPVQ